MSEKPYVTREVVVATCTDCPLKAYTGGITECNHPNSAHLRGVATSDTRRLRGCPLPTQSVLVRARTDAD